MKIIIKKDVLWVTMKNKTIIIKKGLFCNYSRPIKGHQPTIAIQCRRDLLLNIRDGHFVP